MWHVWAVLAVDGPQWACHSPRWHVLPRSTLLHLQGALQGHCPKWSLHFVHFPGLSRSGSHVLSGVQTGQAVHFVPLPGVSSSGDQGLGECTIHMGHASHSPSRSPSLSFPDPPQEHSPRYAMCLLWGAELRLGHSWQMSTVQDPGKMRLATGVLLTVGGR